jgi:hypothetical protein
MAAFPAHAEQGLTEKKTLIGVGGAGGSAFFLEISRG